jgi:hypothetical protein
MALAIPAINEHTEEGHIFKFKIEQVTLETLRPALNKYHP